MNKHKLREIITQCASLNYPEMAPQEIKAIEELIECVVISCGNVIDGAVQHRLPASSYYDLLMEEFGVKDGA